MSRTISMESNWNIKTIHKSAVIIISGSFAERDMQLTASDLFPPPRIMTRIIFMEATVNPQVDSGVGKMHRMP